MDAAQLYEWVDSVTSLSPDIRKVSLQTLQLPLARAASVGLHILRADRVHPVLSGNKYWKLKYNLQAARAGNHPTLLTFGGAFSNHIYATAAAGKIYGFQTVGVIRGERHSPLNPTLAFAEACGMHLHYVDRATYRLKHTSAVLQALHEQFGPFYRIPEGGSNTLAVQGCAELSAFIPPWATHCCLACGTGGTLAGMAVGLPDSCALWGFPVLKGGEFITDQARALLKQAEKLTYRAWQLQTAYHFGGYAKKTPALLDWIQRFTAHTQVSLDYVYTGKLMYGICDLIEKGAFGPGSQIVALHSGGLR